MIKKLIWLLFLIMMTSPVLASPFVIDPARIFEAWYKSNHWEEITAAAIFMSMLAASWKMKPIQNETKAKMVSDLFRMGRYLVGILLCIGYYDFIVSVTTSVAEFFFG